MADELGMAVTHATRRYIDDHPESARLVRAASEVVPRPRRRRPLDAALLGPGHLVELSWPDLGRS